MTDKICSVMERGSFRQSAFFGDHQCPVECVTKLLLFVAVTTLVLYIPLGKLTMYCEPSHCASPKASTPIAATNEKNVALCCLCDMYRMMLHVGRATSDAIELAVFVTLDILYEAKLQFYHLLEMVDRNDLCRSVCCRDEVRQNGMPEKRSCRCVKSKMYAKDIGKEEVDKVIEDEITQKLSDDLLQSLERKFQVDLQKSVDMVLMKIKLLLKNGTLHIQDRLGELQDMLEVIKGHGEKELETCLLKKQNETSVLAEKALHQMVVCGYALIGHDPAQAVHSVLALKNMIRMGIRPIYEQKNEVYSLLKVCGHDHDTLKKVIKCVISKSPIIKSAMMDVTGKLIDGVVSLTKLMAHGAMHEACLIEVIRNIEDEAFTLVEDVRVCVYTNNTFMQEINDYYKENNATVLDVARNQKGNASEKVERAQPSGKTDKPEKEGDVKHMKDLIRRMLSENKVKDIDSTFKNKLVKLQQDLAAVDANEIVKKDKVDK